MKQLSREGSLLLTLSSEVFLSCKYTLMFIRRVPFPLQKGLPSSRWASPSQLRNRTAHTPNHGFVWAAHLSVIRWRMGGVGDDSGGFQLAPGFSFPVGRYF